MYLSFMSHLLHLVTSSRCQAMSYIVLGLASHKTSDATALAALLM